MISIIDTSALITFYMLQKLDALHIIFNEVYVPLTVEREFLKDETDSRFHFLINFYEAHLWFKKCQTFQPDVIAILSLEPKIDDGEKEAMAQYKQLQADLVVDDGSITCIIDEKTGRKVAEKMNITVRGTLALLARLHFDGIIDYYSTTNRLKESRRYSDAIIRKAFDNVKRELGIS